MPLSHNFSVLPDHELRATPSRASGYTHLFSRSRSTKRFPHKSIRPKKHDSFTCRKRTTLQRFPETMVRLNAQESSLACCKVLLLPEKVSSASVHRRRCQLVERATMSESASISYGYDPEVVLPRCSDSWSVNVLLPQGGYIVNH
jgi:hypothetical protein